MSMISKAKCSYAVLRATFVLRSYRGWFLLQGDFFKRSGFIAWNEPAKDQQDSSDSTPNYQPPSMELDEICRHHAVLYL